MNKVIIVGHLGADPELKYTAGNQPVARISVATSENWTDKAGQKQERTEWHRIVVWGKLAEICGKHLTKGRQVYVEGRIQTRSWEDQQGLKRYSTEIVANTVQFLSGGGARAEGGYNSSVGTSVGDRAGGGSGISAQEFPPEPAFDSNEEIPF